MGVLLGFAAFLGLPTPAVAAPKGGQKRAAGEDLFRDCVIPSLTIEIPPAGVASLRRSARTYVRATIREDAITYTNVAIRLKGGPGSFRQLDNAPAFTVNFDRFAEGQTFHGLKKIHLNNSVQDRSFVSEKISRELFEAAGVPAPRAGNARVTLNENELGMYVLVEGIDKQFLRRHFSDPSGNVYDGHSQTDVTHGLRINSGDNREDRSALKALAEAAQEPDLDVRLARLGKTLDLDRFLSFLAMEAILWHWDGYTMNRNNFRIFHDRAAGRMVFIPQGLDQILSQPTGSIFPRTAGLVARSVLAIPEARRRYQERVVQLSTNVFNVDAITKRILTVAEKVGAILAETDPLAAAAQKRRVLQLCQRFRQRANSLQRQLSPDDPDPSNSPGAEAVSGWRERLDQGLARLTEEQETPGKMLLRISTRDGCVASWRTRRVLERGQYRLEGKVKTRSLVLPPNDPQAGATLRISGQRSVQRISGDSDWTSVTFEFGVGNDRSEVELVCEMRANRGDAWFDLSTLKLTRR